MLIKILIVACIVLIAFTLGKGMYCLVHDRGQSERTVKALTWRIGLSVSLFILLFVAFRLGWIQPHAL